jgi:hypothetical protein
MNLENLANTLCFSGVVGIIVGDKTNNEYSLIIGTGFLLSYCGMAVYEEFFKKK